MLKIIKKYHKTVLSLQPTTTLNTLKIKKSGQKSGNTVTNSPKFGEKSGMPCVAFLSEGQKRCSLHALLPNIFTERTKKFAGCQKCSKRESNLFEKSYKQKRSANQEKITG